MPREILPVAIIMLVVGGVVLVAGVFQFVKDEGLFDILDQKSSSSLSRKD